MKYLAAYMMVVAATGNSHPDRAAVEAVLKSVGARYEVDRLDELMKRLDGSDLQEVIQSGHDIWQRKSSGPTGGGADGEAGTWINNRLTILGDAVPTFSYDVMRLISSYDPPGLDLRWSWLEPAFAQIPKVGRPYPYERRGEQEGDDCALINFSFRYGCGDQLTSHFKSPHPAIFPAPLAPIPLAFEKFWTRAIRMAPGGGKNVPTTSGGLRRYDVNQADTKSTAELTASQRAAIRTIVSHLKGLITDWCSEPTDRSKKSSGSGLYCNSDESWALFVDDDINRYQVPTNLIPPASTRAVYEQYWRRGIWFMFQENWEYYDDGDPGFGLFD